MHNNEGSFRDFMRERETAGQAYVRGDSEPLRRLVTKKNPATFFGPDGGSVEGSDEVFADYKRGAESYEPDGDGSFDVIHAAAADDLTYWVGFQRAEAHIKGRKETTPYDLRITEVFRREGEEWKLIPRHTDQAQTVD